MKIVAFLLSALAVHTCYGEVTIKKVEKSYNSGGLHFKVKFEVSTAEEDVPVTWTTSNGKVIPEESAGTGPITVERESKIKIDPSETSWSVTAFIGTSLNWVRLTIDARPEADDAEDPSVPFIIFPDNQNGELQSSGMGQFRIEHSELPEARTQLDRAPLYGNVYTLDRHGHLQGGAIFDSLMGWQQSQTETSRIVKFYNFANDPMVFTFVFRNPREPDNLLQGVEVGRSLVLKVGNEVFPDAFSVAPLGSVNCYNPKKCQLDCVVAAGRHGSKAELRDNHDNTLVSVPQYPNEPLTRIAFSPTPRSDGVEDVYKCVVTDGNEERSHDVKVNFRTIYDIQEDHSEVAAENGGFEAECEMIGFPPPENSIIEFKFEKKTQGETYVPPILVRQPATLNPEFWGRFESRASIDQSQVPSETEFAMVGATCEFVSDATMGFNAESFIPFHPPEEE